MESAHENQIRILPEDLFDLEEHGLFELVNAKLIEKHRDPFPSTVIGVISARIFMHLQGTHEGAIYVGQTYQCFPHEVNRVRRPDLSIVLTTRLEGVSREGHVRIAPDLVIEVISAKETVYAVDERISDYRAAGVKLIWIVNPKAYVINVYRADRTGGCLRDSDGITGEPVFRDFSMSVNDLLCKP